MSEEPSTTSKVISAVTVGLCIVLVLTVVTSIVSVYNSFQIRDQTEQNEDQSKKNQRHIDCIVALGANSRPEHCEPVWDQLLKDRILDSLPPLNTVAASPSP